MGRGGRQTRKTSLCTKTEEDEEAKGTTRDETCLHASCAPIEAEMYLVLRKPVRRNQQTPLLRPLPSLAPQKFVAAPHVHVLESCQQKSLAFASPPPPPPSPPP